MPSRGYHGCPHSSVRIDAASCGLVEPGILPGSPSPVVLYAFARMSRCTRSSLRIDAASCGSTHEAGRCNSTPASCRLPLWRSGRWLGLFFAALRAAGDGATSAASCRLPLVRDGAIGSRASLPGSLPIGQGPPSRRCHEGPRPRTAQRRATHAVARRSMAHWSIRLSDEGAPPARTPAERSSIARPVSPQDAGGCRAIPRPGGPPKTNLLTSGTQPRQPAGRRRRLAYPASLGNPQDAAPTRQLERGHRHIRAKAPACPESREPGKDARLQTVHRTVSPPCRRSVGRSGAPGGPYGALERTNGSAISASRSSSAA